jgi:hypothetical protein
VLATYQPDTFSNSPARRRNRDYALLGSAFLLNGSALSVLLLGTVAWFLGSLRVLPEGYSMRAPMHALSKELKSNIRKESHNGSGDWLASMRVNPTSREGTTASRSTRPPVLLRNSIVGPLDDFEQIYRRQQPLLGILQVDGWAQEAGFPCHLPYTVQRLCHTYPVLRPARALPIRVPLGSRPSLYQLSRRLLSFVRWLPRYYGRDQTPRAVIIATAPRLPDATTTGWTPLSGGRPPGSRAKTVCTCQGLRPRRADGRSR